MDNHQVVHEIVARATFFIVWPAVAALLLIATTVVLVVAWLIVLTPAFKLERTADGFKLQRRVVALSAEAEGRCSATQGRGNAG